MKLTLNEITQKQNISEIKTVSELFFVQALAYCVNNMLPDTELYVGNLRIAENLAHVPHIRENEKYNLVYSNQTAKMLTEFTVIPQTDMRDKKVLERFNAYMSVFSAVKVPAPTALFDYVFFRHDEQANEIHITNTDIAGIYGETSLENNPQAYVYALALLLLISYMKKTELNVVLHTDNAKQVYEYAHVYILMLMGNRLVDRLNIRIDDDVAALCKQRWSATIFERRLRGYMVPDYVYHYKVKDKVNVMRKNDIRVGDVVLVYTSLQDADNTDLASMCFNSCEAGVIYNITNDDISVQLLETLATKIGVVKTIEDGIAAGNPLYTAADKKKCLKPTKLLKLDVCGVEYCANNENCVIMRIPEGVDKEESSNYTQWLDYSIVTGLDARKVKLDIYDTIYTTFCDQGLKFDKERFKSLYFKTKRPEYDIRTERLEMMRALQNPNSVYTPDMYATNAKPWTPNDSVDVGEIGW